ncbi:MAG: PKD domain-containing protein [Elusimicrobiota bacterium]
MRRNATIFFILCLAAGLSAARSAQAASCGDTLMADTTLTADLACGGTALNIGADGVTLDCGGHRIIGPGMQTGSHRGVSAQYAGPSGITVQNCEISGFKYGIYFEGGAQGVAARNNRLHHNRFAFVITGGNAGYNRIEGNTFSGNENDISNLLTVYDSDYQLKPESDVLAGNVFPDPCDKPYSGRQFYHSKTLCPGTYALSSGLHIRRNGITLDGGGAHIRHASSQPKYNGVDAQQSLVKGVTIKNLEISGFKYGINLFNRVKDAAVTGNYIHDNRFGITIGNASDGDNRVENNTITGGEYGVFGSWLVTDRVYHNNINSQSVYKVYGGPKELSYDGEGNWWGRTTEPCFVAGVDSVNADLVDSHPYCRKDGWLNLPPVAEAGPDQTVLLGLPAELDGSGSSDPDGTIASYEWDFGDGSPAGSGQTASHVYGTAGSFTVTLNVTDDFGDSATDTLTVTVQTPEEGLADLGADIGGMSGVPTGTSNALASTIDNALESLASGNEGAASNKIQAFINKVEAQRGKKLSEAQADRLTEAGQALIESISLP